MKKNSGLRWLICILLIISGIGMISDTGMIPGICIAFIGALVCPKLEMGKAKRIIAGIALLLIAAFTTPTTNTLDSVEAEASLAQESTIEASIEETTSTSSNEQVDQTDIVETSGEQEESDLNFTVLDVGQGLSVLIESNGETLLYDGGDRDASSYVVAYLNTQGIDTIDYLIASHYDSDHINGLIGALNVFDIGTVIGPDYKHDSKTYESFISKVNELGKNIQHPAVGDTFTLGSAEVTILAPEAISDDSNDNSVGIKVENGDNTFIVTGDAESTSESRMIASGIDLDVDVLVVGHHGSATSTSWDFLEATTPEYAIISCGEGNSYGHPDADTMEKLESIGADVFRTDKQGEIIAHSNGTNITWNVEPCNDFSSGNGDPGTQPAEQSSSDTSGTVPAYNGGGSVGAVIPVPVDAGDGSQETAAAPVETVASETAAPVQKEELVWLSATGSKYHNKPNCGNMNPNTARQVSLSDAQAMGYEACKKCY